MSSEKGYVKSTTRSLGQIIEEPMHVTKGLLFKSLLFNAIPHHPEVSGERLHGHRGPLVIFSDQLSMRESKADRLQKACTGKKLLN